MTPDALISCLRVAKAWHARRDTVGGLIDWEEKAPQSALSSVRLEALFAIVRRRMLFLGSLDLSTLVRFMASYDAARRGTEQSMMHRVMNSDAPTTAPLRQPFALAGVTATKAKIIPKYTIIAPIFALMLLEASQPIKPVSTLRSMRSTHTRRPASVSHLSVFGVPCCDHTSCSSRIHVDSFYSQAGTVWSMRAFGLVNARGSASASLRQKARFAWIVCVVGVLLGETCPGAWSSHDRGTIIQRRCVVTTSNSR
jgi:hypothetical protein